MFNYPKFHTIVYHNNPLTGRYEKLPSIISFGKMPFDLKVEPTQEDRLIHQGASTIITGRINGGKREFFTGLIPLTNGWFVGNDYEMYKGEKKLSLVMFEFSQDHSILNVYYFNHYYKKNRHVRRSFSDAFINHLATKKGL